MKFKIYFSKSSHLPCVDCDGKLYKAENLEVNVPVKGQWQPVEESPSWVLVGEANNMDVSQKGSIIIT